MTSDPKDRHVLAAAVASQAQAVITTNLRDLPEAASAPCGIEILHPDGSSMSSMRLSTVCPPFGPRPRRRSDRPHRRRLERASALRRARVGVWFKTSRSFTS